MALFRMSGQLLLAEEVAGPLVGVVRVDNSAADRVLLRISQVIGDAVGVAEVMLWIPVRSPAQSARGATTVVSMWTVSTVSWRAAASLGWAAILAAGGLVDAIPNTVSIGVVGRLGAIDMITDHAARRIAGLEMTRSGSVNILSTRDHAGRSAAAGGHRQSQHRSLKHHAKWHGFPPVCGLAGPVIRVDQLH